MTAVDLPIVAQLSALKAAVADHPLVLLSAPPGSGKTTVVPLALLDAPWLEGRRILVLEPRRLAARLACAWMAHGCGEVPGGLIGYRTRQDSAVSARTRIEVMTEGILTRRLQSDPDCADVGLIIFDEIHERHLQTDVGLALARDVQASLRPDLRLLLMSATLDTALLRAAFPAAPWIEANGCQHPIEVVYAKKDPLLPLAVQVRQAALVLLTRALGDILVFLPGEREIRDCAHALMSLCADHGLTLVRLHGDMSAAAQDAVLAASGVRRLILATAIAQTSVTLPAVDAVIDSGLMRIARFQRTSGFTTLVTLPATHDVSDQRAGRAGRIRPGYCYRLWTAANHAGRPRVAGPEIETADLSALALDLALWGTTDGRALAWLTPPPPAALDAGFQLLAALKLTDVDRRPTPAGRAAAELGLPVRAAAMVIGAPPTIQPLAVALAVLLADRDAARAVEDGAIDSRLRWLRDHAHAAPWRQVRRLSQRLRIRPWAGSGADDAEVIAGLLLLAYSDRIAVAIAGTRGAFKLVTGHRAQTRRDDPLATAPVLVAVDVEDGQAGAVVRVAAPLPEVLWRQHVATHAVDCAVVTWDEHTYVLATRSEQRLGELTLRCVPGSRPPAAVIVETLQAALRRSGLSAIPWDAAADALIQRLQTLAHWQPDGGWPDLSAAALLTCADRWLPAALEGDKTLTINVARGIFYGLLSAEQRARLDRDAPPALRLRSQRLRPIRYQAGAAPILSAPVQEFFGFREAPRLLDGRQSLTLELLSPAGRPLQVTTDLGQFWQTVYPQLRRQLSARYPRHAWPADPLCPPLRR